MSQKTSIFYESLPFIYPEVSDVDLSNVVSPPELKKYTDKLENVKRFQDPKYHHLDMIPDNTKAHTIRCVYNIRQAQIHTDTLERIMWLHDIPEYTKTADVSGLERFKDVSIAHKTENEEEALAKEVFSVEDLKLYQDFNLSEDVVRRGLGELPQQQEALIANVVDYIDGNLIFHYFFTKFLTKNEYDGIKPREENFTYVFNVRERTTQALENPEIQVQVKDKINLLLLQQLKAILKLWDKIPPEKIPPKMHAELEKFKKVV